MDGDLLTPGGVMYVDNTIAKGATFLPDFPQPDFGSVGPLIHDFNQMVRDDPRVEQVIRTSAFFSQIFPNKTIVQRCNYEDVISKRSRSTLSTL